MCVKGAAYHSTGRRRDKTCFCCRQPKGWCLLPEFSGTNFHGKEATLAPEVLPEKRNCPFDSAWGLQRKRNGTGNLEEAWGVPSPGTKCNSLRCTRNYKEPEEL